MAWNTNNFRLASATLFAFFAAFSGASGYKLELQSRADTAAPLEVYMANFGSYDDIITGNVGAGSAFANIDISPSFQIAGLTYDGKYRMALETRSDAAGPLEVYMATFDTYSDLMLSNLGSGSGFTQIDVAPNFQIASIAYDGKYRVLLESRADTSAPLEAYMASFDTYGDLLNAHLGTGSAFTQLDVSPSFRIAGLTFDGKYRMALETRTDASSPLEVYMANFDTFDDLMNANLGSGSAYSQIDISPDYQIVGLAYEPSPVPEPSTIVVLGIGILPFIRKRRK